MCVCVLNGLREEQCERIMRWFFRASVSELSISRLCHLFLCTLPCPSCYSNLHHSYHTISSAHLGVHRLRPRISVYHTRLFAHLGVSRLRPSMLTSQPALPLPFGSYCVIFSRPLILLLASRNSARMDRSCFSDASWIHQASLLRSLPWYNVSLAHTSNRGRSATH